MMGFILWLGLSLGIQEGFYNSEANFELFPYYLSAEIHLDNKYYGIYGVYKIDMDKSATKIFEPYLHGYTVGMEFTLGKSYLKIEHHKTSSNHNALQFDSWYNRIEVTIRSKP